MDQKRRKLIKRELLSLQMEEQKLRASAQSAKPLGLKKAIEEKIPKKTYDALESAFCTGFSLVFQKGRRLIELTYRKENLKEEHRLRDDAVQTQASRADLRQMHRRAKAAVGKNLAATTAEGMALGLAGVGLPDIVLFLSTVLKGVYETALHYGFEYESRNEQYLILKMMEASLKSGRAWLKADDQVDQLLQEDAFAVTEEVFQMQLKATASTFAMDMLVLKFVQGFPVVGLIGGAANPVYYQKVMKYVQRKYRKRYLIQQLQ